MGRKRSRGGVGAQGYSQARSRGVAQYEFGIGRGMRRVRGALERLLEMSERECVGVVMSLRRCESLVGFMEAVMCEIWIVRYLFVGVGVESVIAVTECAREYATADRLLRIGDEGDGNGIGEGGLARTGGRCVVAFSTQPRAQPPQVLLVLEAYPPSWFSSLAVCSFHRSHTLLSTYIFGPTRFFCKKQPTC